MRGIKTVWMFLLVLSLFLVGQVPAANAGKPTVAGGCKRCHPEKDGAIRGKLGPISEEFKNLQVKVGNVVWIIQYSDTTTVIQGKKKDGYEELMNLPKGKEILVAYTGDPKKPVATEVSVKQPYNVPERQKITLEEVKALVDKGPDKGAYTLIDARPKGVHLAGHIPTSISLPFGAFEKMSAKVLPNDKGRHLIFYCGGPT